MIHLPLMEDNITEEDINVLIEFLQNTNRFTNGPKVKEFEEAFSKWLGVKYSVFVNSGSSANMATISAIRYLYSSANKTEIIVPTLTWSSDITSVLINGFKPVFVDINMKNLSMDIDKILDAVTDNTLAVFITHVLGFNALSEQLLSELKQRGILLIEDVCESMGGMFLNKKLGTYGLASNFSFYYAHHMSTIEGGMICTDDEVFYETVRMLRSHGMLRESTSQKLKKDFKNKYPNVNEEFFFVYPGFNFRSTELNAVIGINQLKSVDENNLKRNENFKLFIDNLDSNKYYTDFDINGISNYALILITQNPDSDLFNKIVNVLKENNVEFRRGTAGGGNMLIQPFIQEYAKNIDMNDFKNINHIHNFGMYIGNYPSLAKDKILKLCNLLNSL